MVRQSSFFIRTLNSFKESISPSSQDSTKACFFLAIGGQIRLSHYNIHNY